MLVKFVPDQTFHILQNPWNGHFQPWSMSIDGLWDMNFLILTDFLRILEPQNLTIDKLYEVQKLPIPGSFLGKKTV